MAETEQCANHHQQVNWDDIHSWQIKQTAKVVAYTMKENGEGFAEVGDVGEGGTSRKWGTLWNEKGRTLRK